MAPLNLKRSFTPVDARSDNHQPTSDIYIVLREIAYRLEMATGDSYNSIRPQLLANLEDVLKNISNSGANPWHVLTYAERKISIHDPFGDLTECLHNHTRANGGTLLKACLESENSSSWELKDPLPLSFYLDMIPDAQLDSHRSNFGKHGEVDEIGLLVKWAPRPLYKFLKEQLLATLDYELKQSLNMDPLDTFTYAWTKIVIHDSFGDLTERLCSHIHANADTLKAHLESENSSFADLGNPVLLSFYQELLKV